jgi:uncharacterized protein (TIGR03435 family)
MTASAKFLLPFSLLVGMGSRVAWPHANVATNATVYVAMEQASIPFTVPIEIQPGTVSTVSMSVEQTARPSEKVGLLHLLPGALMGIWLCGFVVVAARWCMRWRQVCAIVRAGVPMRTGREVETLRRLQRIEIGRVRRSIEMIATCGPIEPGIFGPLRPVLMWPEGISERLDDAQLEAVLTHEIWHVRRWDNLAATLHMVVEAIFWFHPLVWWLGKRLAEERERACDEEVMQQYNQREVYAESILKVCEFCIEAPLACVSGVTGSDLKRRIVQIMTGQVGRKLTLGRKLLLFTVATIVVAVPIVAGAMGASTRLAQAVRPSTVIAAVDKVATSVKTVEPMLALALAPVAAPQPASAPPAASTPVATTQALGDIAGDWQGTLEWPANGDQPGGKLRIVVKIAKTGNGGWSAVDYSLDQSPRGMNCSNVTLQSGIFSYAIPPIDGSYEGKLSPDGNSIAGQWTQHGSSLSLVYVRATKDTAWEIPTPPAPAKPMAADANPSFEVATIKPSNPDQPGNYFHVDGRNFTTHNISLTGLIEFAYGIQAKQIVNGPEWIDKDKYDINAVPDSEGQPNDKQWKTMLQKLLADRFALTFHHDKRELPVFALTVAKGGPKNLEINTSGGSLPSLFFGGTPGGVMLPGRNATMADFAGVIQEAVLDRPVVDQTGLTGRFDFLLKWQPDDSQFGGHLPFAPGDSAQSDASLPSLFTALQEQLGLKLEAVKIPVDVIVVDHAQKPSAN